MRRVLFTSFVLGLGVFFFADAALSGTITYPEKEANESEANQEAVLKPLQAALTAERYGGRLYYQGVCDDRIKWFGPRFPKIAVRAPQGSGITAVQSVFHSEIRTVGVVKDAGVMRIRIGRVPDLILATKIASVELTPEDQYNEILAIRTIEDAVEVRAAMDRQGIRRPITTLSYPVRMPAPGLPHLPDHLSNLTLDQALDEVAKTFGGVVLFGACGREFHINYSPADRFDLPSAAWDEKGNFSNRAVSSSSDCSLYAISRSRGSHFSSQSDGSSLRGAAARMG